MCAQHASHDGSLESKLLHAEALLLSEQFEEAIAEYRKASAAPRACTRVHMYMYTCTCTLA